jgi:hypothetical protein
MLAMIMINHWTRVKMDDAEVDGELEWLMIVK